MTDFFCDKHFMCLYPGEVILLWSFSIQIPAVPRAAISMRKIITFKKNIYICISCEEETSAHSLTAASLSALTEQIQITQKKK